MRKFIAIMALGALFTVTAYAATASDVVCNDKVIPVTGVVSFTLSKTFTALPVWIDVVNAVYDGTNKADVGTATVSWVHNRANGTVQTNAATAVTLVAGAASTNLVFGGGKYVYRGEPITVTFSTATNGAVQVVADVYAK